jgi:zinc protease
MLLDRTTPPAFQAVTDISFPWPQAKELHPGIPLFVLNKGTQPIIKLSLVFESGTWQEPQSGVAYFTAKMLQEGTQKRTAQEIAAYVDHYGAELIIDIKADYCSIDLTTLTKHFTPMLGLLAELFFESIFPPNQLQILQNLKTQAIKVENEKNSHLANKHFKAALLGKDHPYGRSLTAEDITQITPELLKQYYQQQLLAGCKVFISGQVTDEAIQAVQKHLQPLPNQQPVAQNHPISIQAPTKVQVAKANSLQCAIKVGKVLFTKEDPDYLPMRFVTKLLGGYFGSRLMCNIREDKGYTYGIHAGIIPLKQASYFVIATDVIQEFTEQTCEEIYKEIKILQTQTVSQEELQKVKNYTLGSFLSTVSDPFAMMERFKEAYLYGLDHTFYQQWHHVITQITAPQIKELAHQYLSLDSLTEIRVG